MSRRGPLTRLRMLGQRASHLLPSGVRTRIRRALPPAPAALDSWDEVLGSTERLTLPPAPPEAATAVSAGDGGIRCLLVTDSLDSGGVDQFVGFLARRLPEHGFRVAIGVASSDETRRLDRSVGMVLTRLLEDGVEVIVADDPSEARRRFAAWRPDVVGFHAANWLGVCELADSGVPVVETLHGPHNLSTAPDTGLFSHLDGISRLIAVSEIVALQATALAGRPMADITVIPNGIDVARIARVDRTAARSALGLSDEKLVLSMARLSSEKNGYALESAFDEIVDRVPGGRLLICGRPDDHAYANQMLALRDRMRHGHRVHLRDATSRPDVLLAAADLFVLDSYFEGWSLASMEALGSGLPVVSSDVGGAREQLHGGIPRGVLVPNPLGDPVRVDWRGIAATRFAVQGNRDRLVDAATGILTGAVKTAPREEIAAYSIERYRDDHCVAAHAKALIEALA